MKNKMFSEPDINVLELIVNDWLQLNQDIIEVKSQQMTYNSDLTLYVSSILYDNKPFSLD